MFLYGIYGLVRNLAGQGVVCNKKVRRAANGPGDQLIFSHERQQRCRQSLRIQFRFDISDGSTDTFMEMLN